MNHETNHETEIRTARTAESELLPRLQTGLAGLGEFVAAFVDTDMLDDAALKRLNAYAEQAKAFVAGVAFALSRQGEKGENA